MKSLFAIAFFLFGTVQALACMPPPNATYFQPSQITTILGTLEVMQELRKIGGKDIHKIESIDAGYAISASNGCTVVAKPLYNNPSHNGMCPSLVGAEVVSSGCKQ